MDFSKPLARMGSEIGARRLIEAASTFSLDDALGVLGLEQRASSMPRLLPAIGLITVSAAVGAAVALLLAPSSGKKLRSRLSDEIVDAKHRLSDSISQLEISRNHRHSIS